MKCLKFPIGHSDFETIRLQGSEYIDKTALISEILQDDIQVLLFPRPRRFGKTLNLSMLRYFFDCRKNTAALFHGLAIEQCPEMSHLNQYPVIFLSFKEVKFDTPEEAEWGFQNCFSDLYRQHLYLLEEGHLTPEDQQYIQKVYARQASLEELKIGLSRLMQILQAHHQQKVVVLIDEYDTPIHSAYLSQYYNKIVSFMRALMGAAFKDNSHLFKGIITGILRVSKEGMFSGLNNIRVHGILSNHYAQYYGFTQQEIDGLLLKINRQDLREDIRRWYNGFQFGNLDIYNPWSIISFFDDDFELKPYWVNTSDNALVKQILAQGSVGLKTDFETLISGGEIVRDIDEFVTLSNLFNNEEMAFSLLLFSGYLKVTHKETRDTSYRCTLCIPNLEIHALFNVFLKTFFDSPIFTSSKYHVLIQALTTGDVKLFEKLLSQYLLECFSYFDVNQKEPEKFYHGFVLGLLVTLQDTHWVKSNRESGYGRYDVLIIPKDPSKLGTIIEFKVVDRQAEMTQGIEDAFTQIAEQAYLTELNSLGITQVQTMAIVFWRKHLKLAVR